MGGIASFLQGVGQQQQGGATPVPQDLQNLEQQAQQAPLQTAQNNMQAQQQPQQPQQQPQQAQQPDQISQGLDQATAYYNKMLQDAQQPFGVKQMLQNFFSGVSHDLLPPAQLPQVKAQRAMMGLQSIAQTKAHLQTMQAVQAQNAPVPLIGMDDKPVTDSNGQTVTIPANHAASIYAARMAALGRQGVQDSKNDAANPLMTPEQAQALGHPELAGQEISKAFSGLMGQQMKGDTAETVQGMKDKDAAARNSSAEMIAKGHDLARVEATKMQLQARANLAKDPNALTNTMKTMKQQAQSTLPGIDRALSETQDIAGRLGPAAGRWNDFWQGKVGANDPQFAHYKDEIGMVSSAVTLAHARGRMSNELFEHFQQMFDAGKQSAGNMTQALNVAKEWLGEYANMGTPSSPQGNTPARPSTGFAAWKANQNAPR